MKENPSIKYGLIGAVILVSIGIIGQLLALSYLKKVVNEPENFSWGRSIVISLVSLALVVAVFIYCIVRAQREFRKANPEYTYRQLVGQGLLVTLVLVVVSTGISYIYSYVISPEIRTQTVNLTRQLYETIEMPDEAREKTLQALENQNPVRQLITGFGITLLLGMIVTLISSMVLNKRQMIPNQMR